jgi:cell division inhibitor SepF
MAGAMRRMGIYLGLVEDDDPRGYGRYDSRQSDHADYDRRYGRYADDHYDGDYAADGYADDALDAEDAPAAREPEPLPVRRDRAARPIGLAPAGASAGAGAGAGGARISATGSGPVGATAAKLAVREPIAAVVEPTPAPQPYRITTLHPRTYNEARTIGERFRDGMPVIMNLSEMDDADAKRLVDFAAGLSFGLRGSIERVTAKVFLLSPQNVDVTAEDKARIREGGFFNQS